MSAHPTPVLLPGVLYVAGDRLACAKMRCAGQTALYSGRTIDGVVLRPITGRDVIEYASARPGFARVTCECGHLRAVFDRFEVIALRRPEHDVACVGLSHDGKGFEVALRASEARELAAALLEVAEVIEQGAQ